jgi:hypothetical protein
VVVVVDGVVMIVVEVGAREVPPLPSTVVVE